MIFIYKYAEHPPTNAANTDTPTPKVTLLFNMLITIYEPINKTAILTTCSITWLILEGVMYLCPCKYPLETLRKGIIRRQKDTHFITKLTSSNVLPPLISPKIKLANSFENTKSIKKAITEIIRIIFLPSL